MATLTRGIAHEPIAIGLDALEAAAQVWREKGAQVDLSLIHI